MKEEFMEEEQENRRELPVMVLIITSLILVICACGLVVYLIKSWSAERNMEELRFTYVIAEPITDDTANQGKDTNTSGEQNADPTFEDVPGTQEATNTNKPERTVDIDGLQRDVNADIYAWIYIPGTKVDYPVLQHATDDEYYLNHNVDGKKESAGSIFSQHYNAKDFEDNHTVLYGHNMKNGSMFKSLHYYMDQSFFEENPYIYIYLADETRIYEIFGAYEYGDEHLLLNYNLEDDNVFENYLNTVKNMSDSAGHFNREVELGKDSKIITLSTCIGGEPDKRYLVQAKLIAVE